MTETVCRFFTIADYIEEEKWLREQHRAGRKLVGIRLPCFYIFESCEPEDVIYRLDYKNSDYSEEYLGMYRDFGWEFFARCAGWLYFRKPAAAAETEGDGELFSDNASRLDMITHIVKTRLLPVTVLFLGCTLPNMLRVLCGSMPGIAGMILMCICSALVFANMFLLIYCGVKLSRIRADIEKNGGQ